MDEEKELEKKEQQEAFNIFDRDKDGKLNIEELAFTLMSLGYMLSDEEISSIMSQHGEGDLISFEPFSNFLFNRSKDTEMEDEIMECFKEMDKDNDGKISKKDLKYLLYSIGEKLNDEEIAEIIEQVDTTGEGYINYHDMVKLMLTK